MAALAATGAFPLSAFAAANVKMMIPANPGGGWDTTGRALGKAMQDAGVASSVTYDNKGGAAGITPAQRKELIDALSKTYKHKAWQDAMEKNGWTPAWLAGDEFANFVDAEFASLRATMAKSGMI